MKRKHHTPRSWLTAILGALALLFLGLPIVVLALRGLQTRAWEGLPDVGIAEAVGLSFFTTFCSVGLTLLFGTPLAYILARWQFRFKRPLSVLVELPIVLPPAVAGLALLLTFGRRGFLGPTLELVGITLPFSTAAVVLAQAFVAAPFYIRAAQVGFQGVPREIEDAARVDGASGLALFWRVTLPLSLNALAAGLVLSWARALGEFGATILFAGSLQGRTQTMPLLVYNVLERDIDAAIWTGLLLVVMALGALLLSKWLVHRGDGDADSI
ncbi:MAG: molybdate ABC transporter permease subunit [Burkholderiales bacterium]|nr:molybdate ABC transporter permease subunit [Anaerolineae bacterium]